MLFTSTFQRHLILAVNHELILDKLKNYYSIDGRLLKFLKNYLCDREQRVVLDGVKSPRSLSYQGSPKDPF